MCVPICSTPHTYLHTNAITSDNSISTVHRITRFLYKVVENCML